MPVTGPCHPVELIQSNQNRERNKQEEVKGGSELNQQEKSRKEDGSAEDPFQMHTPTLNARVRSLDRHAAPAGASIEVINE